MSKRMGWKNVTRFALAVVCVPLCLAGTCPPQMNPPPGGGTNTLLSEQAASTAGAPIGAGANGCPGATTGLQRTFNAEAGKVVSVTVTGPVSTSRPQIRVIDILGSQVANTGPTPTAQSNTTSFTPTAASLFILQVNECAPGIAAGSVYTLLITQAQ